MTSAQIGRLLNAEHLWLERRADRLQEITEWPIQRPFRSRSPGRPDTPQVSEVLLDRCAQLLGRSAHRSAAARRGARDHCRIGSSISGLVPADGSATTCARLRLNAGHLMEEDWRLSASLGLRTRPSAQARPFRARARLAGEPGSNAGHSGGAPARSSDLREARAANVVSLTTS